MSLKTDSGPAVSGSVYLPHPEENGLIDKISVLNNMMFKQGG
jgi:hypothetical protein